MKHALVNGQRTPASPDAPATAVCPDCGGAVERRARGETYFWRHIKLPLGGCPPPNPGPESGGDLALETRRVGEWVIEGHPDTAGGPALVLRSGEGTGQPSGLVIPLRHVRRLAAALLDAAVELAAVAADRSTAGE